MKWEGQDQSSNVEDRRAPCCGPSDRILICQIGTDELCPHVA